MSTLSPSNVVSAKAMELKGKIAEAKLELAKALRKLDRELEKVTKELKKTGRNKVQRLPRDYCGSRSATQAYTNVNSVPFPLGFTATIRRSSSGPTLSSSL
jgi:hypothetical protein